MASTVSKLGGKDRFGVTPEHIKLGNPGDLEKLSKKVKGIADTSREIEILRVTVKELEARPMQYGKSE